MRVLELEPKRMPIQRKSLGKLGTSLVVVTRSESSIEEKLEGCSETLSFNLSFFLSIV